jgi:hypothetical protein
MDCVDMFVCLSSGQICQICWFVTCLVNPSLVAGCVLHSCIHANTMCAPRFAPTRARMSRFGQFVDTIILVVTWLSRGMVEFVCSACVAVVLVKQVRRAIICWYV